MCHGEHVLFQGTLIFRSSLRVSTCWGQSNYCRARFPVYELLGQFVDTVVVHHWENGLNYLYYDVLYGGYPLIHNSEFLKDVGYYFDAFDVQSGASRWSARRTPTTTNWTVTRKQTGSCCGQ